MEIKDLFEWDKKYYGIDIDKIQKEFIKAKTAIENSCLRKNTLYDFEYRMRNTENRILKFGDIRIKFRLIGCDSCVFSVVNDDETIGDCVFHICTWLEGERILSDCVQFDSHNVRFYFHFDYKSGELKDFSRESLR